MNVWRTQIEELVLKQVQLAPQYLLEISRDGNLDQVLVTVELAPAFLMACAEERAGIADALEQSVQALVGTSARVRVRVGDAGSLERARV